MSSAEAVYVALSQSCAQVNVDGTQLKIMASNTTKIPLLLRSQLRPSKISCKPRTTVTEQMGTSILALPGGSFMYLVRRIGMRCLTPDDWRVLLFSIQNDGGMEILSSVIIKQATTVGDLRDSYESNLWTTGYRICNLNNEENDFMLDNSYEEETMEELTTAIMLMARIQPADVSHVKCKTIIQTSDDDQIDSNIIFDDPYVENNGSTSEHDLNAHDEYREIQMLAYNVQREAENKKRLNNELKKQKKLLQKELETYIIDLEEKPSSHDRIVYKMGQSIQTIHMLGKKPNKVYDPFLKAGLGYKNPERLKKAIEAQPNMYDREMLHSAKLKIDSPDLEETLEDAEESRLKMRNKMI
ncbi:hypothetical protein Tco_1403401 [Tanacetum coccineum]